MSNITNIFLEELAKIREKFLVRVKSLPQASAQITKSSYPRRMKKFNEKFPLRKLTSEEKNEDLDRIFKDKDLVSQENEDEINIVIRKNSIIINDVKFSKKEKILVEFRRRTEETTLYDIFDDEIIVKNKKGVKSRIGIHDIENENVKFNKLDD